MATLTENQKTALNYTSLGETVVLNKNGTYHTSLTNRPVNKRVVDTLVERGFLTAVGVTSQSPKSFSGVFVITSGGRKSVGAPTSGLFGNDDLAELGEMKVRYVQKRVTQRYIWPIRKDGSTGRGISYTQEMIDHILRNLNRYIGTKPDEKPGDELVKEKGDGEGYFVLGLRKRDQGLRKFTKPNTARYEARRNSEYVKAGHEFETKDGPVVINIEPVLPHSFFVTCQVGDEVKLIATDQLVW